MRRKKSECGLFLNQSIPPCRGCVRSREGNYATVTFGPNHTYPAYEKTEPLLYWDYVDEDELKHYDDIEEYISEYYNDPPFGFYAEVDDKANNRIGVKILYSATPESESVERTYSIRLTEKEQAAIFRKLNRQCKAFFGKTCKAILKEIRAGMTEKGSLKLWD